MNSTLKVIKKGETIQKVRTHSTRRFLNHLRTINWRNGPLNVYLRVSYGKQEDCFGKLVNFYNDGWYQTEGDLWLAFNAFREVG